MYQNYLFEVLCLIWRKTKWPSTEEKQIDLKMYERFIMFEQK